MTLLTKVGSFDAQTSTGTQAITGVGFKPKAIIFWLSDSATASPTPGTFNPHASPMIGMTTGPSNSYAIGTASLDTANPSTSARRMALKALCFCRWDQVVAEADINSMDSDGFTLNWTSQAWAVARRVCFLAIGGTDVTGAQVVNWTTPTATGLKAVTGVGFKPDLVLHCPGVDTAALPAGGTSAYLGLGVMNRHGQQWAVSIFSASAASPTNTSRGQQTDACLYTSDVGDAVFAQAHYVSMDADGFTLNFSTQLGSTARQCFSLCLKGVSSKIGSYIKDASISSLVVKRFGFSPQAILFADTQNLSAAVPAVWAAWGMGAADGSSQRATPSQDVDNVSGAQAKSAYFSDAVLVQRDQTTLLTKASLTSLDADGMTLAFSPSSGNALEQLYLAIGPRGKNTYPATVGT